MPTRRQLLASARAGQLWPSAHLARRASRASQAARGQRRPLIEHISSPFIVASHSGTTAQQHSSTAALQHRNAATLQQQVAAAWPAPATSCWPALNSSSAARIALTSDGHCWPRRLIDAPGAQVEHTPRNCCRCALRRQTSDYRALVWLVCLCERWHCALALRTRAAHSHCAMATRAESLQLRATSAALAPHLESR